MSDIEKMLSRFLMKDPRLPVELHIEAEDVNELLRGSDHAGVLKPVEPEATITIPQAVYEEIYAAAVKFEILARSYHANKYGVDSAVEKAVFGPSKSAEAGTTDA